LRKKRPRPRGDEGGLRAFWNWISGYRRDNHYPFKQHLVARLAAFAIAAIWFRFIWKELLMIRISDPNLEYVLGFIFTFGAVLGLIAGIIVVGSTLWFVTNAPEGQIDERERDEKLRAYQLAYQYLMALMAIGVVLLEFAPKIYEDMKGTTAWQPDIGTLQNFVVSIFLTGLLLPTMLLAIQSPTEDPEEAE
jgi:hypothetical protein